jgi:hypothetical protein
MQAVLLLDEGRVLARVYDQIYESGAEEVYCVELLILLESLERVRCEVVSLLRQKLLQKDALFVFQESDAVEDVDSDAEEQGDGVQRALAFWAALPFLPLMREEKIQAEDDALFPGDSQEE